VITCALSARYEARPRIAIESRKLVLYGTGIASILGYILFPPIDPILSSMADTIGTIILRYIGEKIGGTPLGLIASYLMEM